jgi:hypothetical protein
MNHRGQGYASRRIGRELETARVMIELYCRGHHKANNGLCDDCQVLWDYTRMRVERCPFGRAKPTCVNCTVHCFKREMRDRIGEVMRYAGPKMPLRHPILSVFHFIDGKRPTPRRSKRKSPRD